jgi:Ca-activated chloride channel family protein
MLEMCLEQRFRNAEDQNVEVTYTFPLPWGAVLMGIEVTLNGEKLHGLVAAKQEAREQYEHALSEGNTSILLSRNADQSYTLELGNLLAKELCVVVLRYAQLLQPEQGSLRLMLPTTIAPRFGDAVRDGRFEPHAAPVSNASVEYPFDISLKFFGALAQARVSSPSHALASQHSQEALVVRLALSSWLDRDFVVVLDELPQRSSAIAAVDQVELGSTTAIASFSPVLESAEVRPLALKLLVDCSGSMNGDSIEAARRALAHIVGGLSSEDRFSLSRFGSTVEHRCKALWVGAGPAKSAAIRWVEKLDADLGGTEMALALKSTMALPHSKPCDLLLVTDGEIYGIDDVVETAASAGHRIFVVGIGASPAETHLRRLATATGGACEFVAPGEAVEPAVLRMFHRLRSPGVADLRIEWLQGCELMGASLLPTSVFDGDTLTVFGRLQTDRNNVSQAPVRLLGKYNGQQGEVVLAEMNLEFIEDSANTVSRLWANSRCDELAKGDDAPGQAAALAERYQLVTDHTNFVLVHERSAEDKPEGMPELRQVDSMLAAGWGGLGRTRSQPRFVDAPDVQYSITPTMDSMSIPSVWRSSRSRAAAAPELSSFMDDLELPAFLRKQGDDSTPFEAPPVVSRTNPDWWAGSLDFEEGDVEFYAGEGSLSVGDDGYKGLTPAGLREFLRINAKKDWPSSYEGLREVGLGHEVAEWLEFVVGVELGESLVVCTFLDVVCKFTFSEVHEPAAIAGNTRADLPLQEAPAPNTLAQELARQLVCAQTRRWPERVVHFAEGRVAV